MTLLPPVPDPGKIVCIGLNYRDHAAEVKLELPEHVTASRSGTTCWSATARRW